MAPDPEAAPAKASRLLAAVPEEERDEYRWLMLRDGTPVPGDRGGAVVMVSEVRLTRPGRAGAAPVSLATGRLEQPERWARALRLVSA